MSVGILVSPSPTLDDAQTPACAVTENEARQALIEAGLSLAPLGLGQGRSGNLSVRWHRGGEAGMLITPSGLDYTRTQIDDLVWVPLAQPTGSSESARSLLESPARFDGTRKPSSEWRVHRDLLRLRPEAVAVVHTHSPHASALSCLPRVQQRGIPAFHYMVAVAGGADLRCAPYATFGSQALSDAVCAALRDRRACLLAHHGQIALGSNLDQTLGLALEVESLARMYVLALQCGEPAVLCAEEMARVLDAFGDYGPDRARLRGAAGSA